MTPKELFLETLKPDGKPERLLDDLGWTHLAPRHVIGARRGD